MRSTLRHSSREFLSQYDNRFDIQITRGGLVQQQLALGGEIFFRYGVIEQEQRGLMWEKTECEGSIVIAADACGNPAEFFTRSLQGGDPAVKMLRDHLFDVSCPGFVLCVRRRY